MKVFFQTSEGAWTHQHKHNIPMKKDHFQNYLKKKTKKNGLLLSIGSGLHFKNNTSNTSPQNQTVSQFELKCV